MDSKPYQHLLRGKDYSFFSETMAHTMEIYAFML